MMWFSLMSYAIVTRTEPRWIESRFYNCYTFLLSVIMLFSSIGMQMKLYRTLNYRSGSWYIDDVPLSDRLKLNSKELLVLDTFLSEENAVNCSVLVPIISTDEPLVKQRCNICHKKNQTASECDDFKKLKANVIHPLNTKLEIAEIGAIIPAGDNRLKIKEHGWKLKFFNDIQIRRHTRKKQHLDNRTIKKALFFSIKHLVFYSS